MRTTYQSVPHIRIIPGVALKLNADAPFVLMAICQHNQCVNELLRSLSSRTPFLFFNDMSFTITQRILSLIAVSIPSNLCRVTRKKIIVTLIVFFPLSKKKKKKKLDNIKESLKLLTSVFFSSMADSVPLDEKELRKKQKRRKLDENRRGRKKKKEETTETIRQRAEKKRKGDCPRE